MLSVRLIFCMAIGSASGLWGSIRTGTPSLPPRFLSKYMLCASVNVFAKYDRSPSVGGETAIRSNESTQSGFISGIYGRTIYITRNKFTFAALSFAERNLRVRSSIITSLSRIAASGAGRFFRYGFNFLLWDSNWIKSNISEATAIAISREQPSPACRPLSSLEAMA